MILSTVLVGGSYVITPDILVGAEIRHENLAPNGQPIGHALFVGPHLFPQLDEDLTASFTSEPANSILRSSSATRRAEGHLHLPAGP
jgi:hypothetical protein